MYIKRPCSDTGHGRPDLSPRPSVMGTGSLWPFKFLSDDNIYIYIYIHLEFDRKMQEHVVKKITHRMPLSTWRT